jgi:hypothetical protein
MGIIQNFKTLYGGNLVNYILYENLAISPTTREVSARVYLYKQCKLSLTDGNK